jgi:DNA-binding beta-propeller fold protein YncE
VKKLMLVLVPLTVFAQVEVDTIIRLPMGLRNGVYLQDLNELYLCSYAFDQIPVLDCSTYQLKARIPVQGDGEFRYTYNWRRQKLYVAFGEGPESTLVIDAAGDSVLRWLDVYREFRNDVYLSDLDVRFKPAVDTLYEYECDADTIIRRWPIHSTWCSWDSVHRKLYVGQGSQKKLYVYDYLADSCLKVIDVSAVYAQMPDACVFSYNHHRAYVAHGRLDWVDQEVGIIDTERDTLVRVLPVNVAYGLYLHVAVDESDGKAYITSYPDTMWVVDCATDSLLKKFECGEGGRTDVCIRWVPWSNRIYLINRLWGERYLVVIDCNTDSIIKSDMYLGLSCYDIQLDPVHQRVFLIGAPDTNSITVLRDTGYAAVSTPRADVVPAASGLQARMVSGGCDIQYSLAAPGHVELSVYDQLGREVRQLVDSAQSAGQHRVTWDCQDPNGNRVPLGAYFIQLRSPAVNDEQKVIVTR